MYNVPVYIYNRYSQHMIQIAKVRKNLQFPEVSRTNVYDQQLFASKPFHLFQVMMCLIVCCNDVAQNKSGIYMIDFTYLILSSFLSVLSLHFSVARLNVHCSIHITF